MNHMTGIELPQTTDGILDTVELIESCSAQHPQPQSTWLNHVHVLLQNGTCRPKNEYYHVRQSIEEGWYRDECENPDNCPAFTDEQMLQKVSATVQEYAAYQSWNPVVVQQVLKLILGLQGVSARNAWTVAHKSKMKNMYNNPVRHSIYNYGVGVHDTASFAHKYGFQEKFVQWLHDSAGRLGHILFDVSVDFIVSNDGVSIEVVGAAIGGGSL